MTDTQQIAAAVEARLRAMRWDGNIATLDARSPVSDNTWRNLIRKGMAPVRTDKRRQIAHFLGWPDDALDQLEASAGAAGRLSAEPVPSPTPFAAATDVDRLGSLEDAVRRQGEEIRHEVGRLVHAVNELVKALRDG